MQNWAPNTMNQWILLPPEMVCATSSSHILLEHLNVTCLGLIGGQHQRFRGIPPPTVLDCVVSWYEQFIIYINWCKTSHFCIDF